MKEACCRIFPQGSHRLSVLACSQVAQRNLCSVAGSAMYHRDLFYNLRHSTLSYLCPPHTSIFLRSPIFKPLLKIIKLILPISLSRQNNQILCVEKATFPSLNVSTSKNLSCAGSNFRQRLTDDPELLAL